MNVMEANAWDNQAAVVHLRSSLKGARNCGGACNDLAEIFTALRARFGPGQDELSQEGGEHTSTHATLMREPLGRCDWDVI